MLKSIPNLRNIFIVFILVIIVSVFFYISQVFGSKQKEFWPTIAWKTSLPEAQGVNSEGLASMVEDLEGENVHSVVVIRNGYIIMEGYNADNTDSTKQEILSATKSVTSALIGIAIKQNKIGGVEEPLSNYFPQLDQETDTRKKNINIRNLLTMTSTLNWSNNNEASTLSMIKSTDWVKHLLDLPLNGEPGTQFVYSNGGPHLLSAILQKATAKTEAEYAKEVLFNPIGITDVAWDADPQGHSIGSFGIHITARDIAKFGYLYLNEGRWDGKTIIPKEWITESTQKYITFKDRNVHPLEEAYGYLWWLHANQTDIYSANGSGGQSIVVMPKENMVVVITANNTNSFFADPIIENKLLPAIKSSKPLPENAQGESLLKNKLQVFKQAHDAAS